MIIPSTIEIERFIQRRTDKNHQALGNLGDFGATVGKFGIRLVIWANFGALSGVWTIGGTRLLTADL